MPYSSVSEVPKGIPRSKRKQFLEVFNSVFQREKKKGQSDKEAEQTAFAEAYGAIRQEKNMRADFNPFQETQDGDPPDIKLAGEVRKKEKDGYHPASHYLVVEDPKKPSTWHLRVRNAKGDLDTGLLGAAHAALYSNFRGKGYEGPNKAQAKAKLKKLYAEAKLEWPGDGKKEKGLSADGAATKSLFAPMANFKVEKKEDGTVHLSGVLAAEEVDQVGEIFDYESSKAYFEKWNSRFAQKTEGQSVGNLRSMHQLLCAGKFTAMTYDDDKKVISCEADVIDKAEAEKVLKNCYLGLSIGARYVKKFRRDDDPEKTMRWTADPFEGSLADNPCMPSATIEEVAIRSLLEEQIRKLSPSSIASEHHETPAEKDLSLVACLARSAQELFWLKNAMECEQIEEGDEPENVVAMRGLVDDLCALLVSYTEEEGKESSSGGLYDRHAENYDAAEDEDGGKTMDRDTLELVSELLALKRGGNAGAAALRRIARAHKALAGHAKKVTAHHEKLGKHLDGLDGDGADKARGVHKEMGDALEAMSDHVDEIGDNLGDLHKEPQSDNAEDGSEKIARRVAAELEEKVDALVRLNTKMAELVTAIAGAPLPSGVVLNATAAAVSKAGDSNGRQAGESVESLCQKAEEAEAQGKSVLADMFRKRAIDQVQQNPQSWRTDMAQRSGNIVTLPQ